MKVENMAMNQFIIYLDNCTAFQSYDTLIAVRKDRIMYYGSSWNHSRTTLKYFKLFTNMDMPKKNLQLFMEGSDYWKFASKEELQGLIKCQKE